MEESPKVEKKHLRPLKTTKKKPTKAYYDPIQEKKKKLQEFLSARGDSASDIAKKFGFFPREETKKLFLADGAFNYRASEIEAMLEILQDAVSTCSAKNN